MLDALKASGITLRLDGEMLRVRGKDGAPVSPETLEAIRAEKPRLLCMLVAAEAVDSIATLPSPAVRTFDHQRASMEMREAETAFDGAYAIFDVDGCRAAAARWISWAQRYSRSEAA